MTARLVLICHGSTEAVRKAAFPADEPLDERGRARFAALARRLPRTDHCWASPELRTRETAQALGLDATALPELRECDYGAWRGLTFDEVYARDPAGAAEWLNDTAATPHGGESILDLTRRVAGWLAEKREERRLSIVITHATIIRAAVVHAIEAVPRAYWRIDIAPLSVTRLSGAQGRWNLTCCGCTTPDAM